MSDLASLWWGWASQASLQVFILVPLVALADRLAAGRAGVQAALWSVVMIRLVCPPAASMLLPAAAIDRLPAVTTMGGPSGALVETMWLVWLGGAVACAAAARWRHTRLRRAWTEAVDAPADIVALTRSAAGALGLRRIPRVMVHREATRPAVVGIFKPTVILPETLAGSGIGADLRHALLHELAHVRRRDPLRALVCQSIQILYWYHPLVWASRARLSTLREIACDARVVTTTGARDEYRHTLLRLARPLVTVRPAGTLGLFGRRSELLVRLSVLDRPLPRLSPLRRLAASALVLTCVAGALAIDAATSIRVAATEPETNQGCLRLRLAVYALLAEEAAAAQERER